MDRRIRRARKTSAESCSATSGNNFMSRIGKQPIVIPAKVKVEVKGQSVHVEGPKGKLNWELPKRTAASRWKDDKHHYQPRRRRRAVQGVAWYPSRALVNNMVKGVAEGFVKKLEIQGVGFKAAVTGQDREPQPPVISHPINYDIPDQIKVTVEENTKLTIEGPDKMVVGKVASEIRSYYPPEPYKGKGVRYAGEHVVRKEGKTVQ